jgi:ATP-dependent helicase/nuclease subunit B
VAVAPKIYTVASGTPFLTALARALLAGDLPSPGGRRPGALELADITLLLPTRRATRALQEAFLEAAGGTAMLLPKIRPLAEGSEDLDLIASVEHFAATGEDIAAPRMIGALDRQLALTELVLRWTAAAREPDREGEMTGYAAAGASTPAQVAHLAKELARLMDTLEAQGVDPERLRDLVPENFSEHWSRTLQFLQIVTQFWPAHLAEQNLASPVAHRQRLLRAEAKRLAASPPKAPVIVAGITGADRAACELIEAVLRLPHGALVLPALDQALDVDSWQLITPKHPEHPQFGMAGLLAALGIARDQVRPLPGIAPSSSHKARASLTSEAMRPAGTTERWHRFVASASKRDMEQALAGVSLLESATAEDEAEAIALMLREVAERPKVRAALVTPDQSLARRVAARLAAWDLHVVPSIGVAFARTEIGAFLELTADAAAREFEPVALMTLLKHRLCRPGLSAMEVRRGARTLELAVFRAPYFGKGLQGVVDALDRLEGSGARKYRHRAVQRLQRIDFEAARMLLAALEGAFAPMTKLLAGAQSTRSLQALSRAHTDAATALAGAGDALWQGSDGEWAAKFFAGLQADGLTAPAMRGQDYVEFYRTLVADKTIRGAGPTHPRISIWDPFESHLRLPDLVILGSLNEGVWPRAADPGPWVNRPMRRTLGLPAPEERIGEEAHAFVSLLGAERVTLTRAAKVDGVPTVPSRWLLRLRALLAGLGHQPAADQPWLSWAQQRGAIEGQARPVKAPEPRPAVALRPRQLSVTTVEKWIANPYAIFAERILGLQALPVLGREPDAALRGQIVHDALSRFAQAYPDALPKDAHRKLVDLAEVALTDYTGSPRVAAFWAPRFARFAAWFAETEPARREGVSRSLAEVEGALVLAGPAGPFTLKARADRIDVAMGGMVITDYKSGANLQTLANRAISGEAPQLPLEAAIALAGGFTGIASGAVALLRYISASGGEPPGNEFDLKTEDVAGLARKAQEGLARLIAEFDRESTPYRAVRRPRFKYDYDDYAHLARVAEWSAEGLAENGEEVA